MISEVKRIINEKSKKMKKVSVLFMTMLLTSVAVFASNQVTDYFIGKWELSTTTDDGEATKIILNINRNEGKLDGTISVYGSEAYPVNGINENQNIITVFFESSGHDVYLEMAKEDDNSVRGHIMDMYDFKGKRIKIITSNKQ